MHHRDVVLRRHDPDAPLTRQTDAVRLVRGITVDRAHWEALDPLERRRLLVVARYETMRSRPPISHRSAAALWGFPDLDPDDGRLHVVDSFRRRTHSGPGVVRHAAVIRASEVVAFDGRPVTDAHRTVVDVLRSASFAHGVLVLDHALRTGVVTKDSVRARLAKDSSPRGAARAARVVEFSDGRSESPAESLSRIRLHDVGVPAPDLQHEFVTDVGRFRVDFWWPAHGVIGEFDGRVKYGSGDPDVLWREKTREDALRRVPGVRGVARWTSADLADPARLARIVRSAGVRRSTKHRPADETPS